MLNLEVGGDPFRLACRRSTNPFSCMQSPQLWKCSFPKRLNLASLAVAQLLQHPCWDPEEQTARLTLFKFILKAVASSLGLQSSSSWGLTEAAQGARTSLWLKVALSFHLVMLASRGLGALEICIPVCMLVPSGECGLYIAMQRGPCHPPAAGPARPALALLLPPRLPPQWAVCSPVSTGNAGCRCGPGCFPRRERGVYGHVKVWRLPGLRWEQEPGWVTQPLPGQEDGGCWHGAGPQHPCATCSSRAEHTAVVLGGQTANTPLLLLYIVLPACWEAR